jgi:hypothetical protein
MPQRRKKSSRIDPDERRKKLEALYRNGGVQSDADAIVTLVCDRFGVNDPSQARALLEQEYVYGHGKTKGGRPHFLMPFLKGATGRNDIHIPDVMLYLTEQVLREWMQESETTVARSAEVAGERFVNEFLKMRIDDLPKDRWDKFISRLIDVYPKKERRLRMSADAVENMCRMHPAWPLFEKDLRRDVPLIIKEYIVKCLKDQDRSSYFREVIQLYDDRNCFWNVAVPIAIAIKDKSFSKVLYHGAIAFYFYLGAGTKLIEKLQTYGIFPNDDLCGPEHERLKIGFGDLSDKLRLSYRREFYRGLGEFLPGIVEQSAQRDSLERLNDRAMFGLLSFYEHVRVSIHLFRPFEVAEQ